MGVSHAAHSRGCLSEAPPDVMLSSVNPIQPMGRTIERVRGGYARGKHQTRGEFPSETVFLETSDP
jgi:hypothetical protein